MHAAELAVAKGGWELGFLERTGQLLLSLGGDARSLDGYLRALRRFEPVEIAPTLLFATHVRNATRSIGYNLLEPLELVKSRPELAETMARQVQASRIAGGFLLADGLTVWVHTLRASSRHDLLPDARAMWRELERGLPYVPQVLEFHAHNFAGLQPQAPDLIPMGFARMPSLNPLPQ